MVSDFKKIVENTLDGSIDPVHYKTENLSGLEPIEVIEKWGLGFNDGNAVKYIARSRNGSTKKKDLIKAANYLYREATGSWLPKNLQEIAEITYRGTR